jgi:hypothetical protein
MYPRRLVGRSALPQPLSTERFRLEPLNPTHLEVDYAAIVATADHLDGTMAPPGWLSGDFTFTLDDEPTWDAALFAIAHQWVTDHWPFERVVYPGRSMPWNKWLALPSR